MNKIEEYFDDGQNLFNKDFYNKNTDFNIENNDLFKLFVDINLWANNNTESEEQDARQEQPQFSNSVSNRDKKCIITGKHIPRECQACHIIPVKDGGSYDINNGLFINSCHHTTFDDNLWSINPETSEIDVISDDAEIVGSIIEYVNNVDCKKRLQALISDNYIMKHYLEKRWNKYILKKIDFI